MNLTTVFTKAVAVTATVFFSFLTACNPADLPQDVDNPNGNEPDKPVVLPDSESGISFAPEVLNADQACTIYFKPSATSSISKALYNCSTDIYAHIGVFYDDDWKFVQAEWNQNIEKCKFTKTGENEYKLEIQPSLREYFQSGTTPLERIALVIRNADGTKQTKPDQFISVTDDKYKAGVFTPDPVVKETKPSGALEGINYNSDNSVTLVLHDLTTKGGCYDYAYVIGEFSGWKRQKEYMMKRDDAAGDWWITLRDLDPEKEYMFQYHVGNSDVNFRIHDPYTEVVYDPWNDKYISSTTYPNLPAYPTETKDRVSAFKINRDNFNWTVPNFAIKDHNNIVIYEMHFRDFTTSKDILGAMDKLDYLQTLGVGALELMPVQEFEGNDSWGYNPCSYFAMDKAYGTRTMYKQFIDECHKRGMAVILDVVYNHTTGAHPYARLYWDSAANNISSLNPCYNVNTPHGFGVFQDINHENPQISNHIKRSLEYLLKEYKVDGFRFDLTKGFTNHSGKDGSYDQLRVDILKGYNNAIKAVNPDAMVILEHFVDAENNALGEEGMHMWGNNNHNYTKVIEGSNVDLSYIYDPNCYRVGYMESHDEERICCANPPSAGTSNPTSVSWGICGTMTGWGDSKSENYSKDIAFSASGNVFVARNVSISASDEFKIRGNNSWDDTYNYGAAEDKTVLPLAQAFSLTLGASSKNMKAPAADVYDLWFSPGLAKVWLMKSGETPDIPEMENDDPLTLKMRRAGLAAAFFLTVPGPKMIWQFGELGYDISIEYGGSNVSAKPVKWDYLNEPARKALYDTYSGLLKFRNENPEFFTKGANFRQYVGTSEFEYGKFIFGETAGKAFCVMGNFDNITKEITAQLPFEGHWFNWFNPEESVSGNKFTAILRPGEFRLVFCQMRDTAE